jgi:hypothetical protein
MTNNSWPWSITNMQRLENRSFWSKYTFILPPRWRINLELISRLLLKEQVAIGFGAYDRRVTLLRNASKPESKLKIRSIPVCSMTDKSTGCLPGILRYVGPCPIHPEALQNSPLAPPPPDCPPPKRKSGPLVCGPGVVAWGDSRPNPVDPTFIHCLSFPDRRAAVKPWRIPPGPRASQRRIKTATLVDNMPRSIGSQVCRGQPR